METSCLTDEKFIIACITLDSKVIFSHCETCWPDNRNSTCFCDISKQCLVPPLSKPPVQVSWEGCAKKMFAHWITVCSMKDNTGFRHVLRNQRGFFHCINIPAQYPQGVMAKREVISILCQIFSPGVTIAASSLDLTVRNWFLP